MNKKLLLLSTLLYLVSWTAYAQVPDNDNCGTAIELSVSSLECANPLVGNNTEATDSENATPFCASYFGGDLWYSVTVPASGVLSIETSGDESFDTGLAIYSGDCDGLEAVGCNDDGGDGTFSLINIIPDDGLAGTAIFIQVWEYGNDNQGEFNICAYEPDFCAPPSYTFEQECVDDENGTIVFNITDIGTSPFFFISDGINDPLLINMPGEYVLGPYENLTELGISLEPQNPDCGAYEFIIIDCTPPPPAPDNDQCIDAIALELSSSACENAYLATNSGATDSPDIAPPTCAFYSGGDIWFTATVPESGLLNVETSAADTLSIFDTGMAVYYGTCEGLELIECDDDGGNGTFSLISVQDESLAGQTIYIRVWDYGNNNFGNFFVCTDDPTPNCDFPEVTFETQCIDETTYEVIVNVTSLGSSSVYSISDNLGNTPVGGITEPGTYTYGAYDNLSSVSVNLVSDEDFDCNISSDNLITNCLPAPANDLCSDAIPLVASVGAECSNIVIVNNSGANISEADPGCAFYSGGDLWYSITVPASGELTLQTLFVEESNIGDTGLAVYSGDCSNPTLIECNDDGGENAFSLIEITPDMGLAETLIWVQVWEFGNDSFGEFGVCALTSSCTDVDKDGICVEVDCDDNDENNTETDVDQDGVCTPIDCNDTDADIYPGASCDDGNEDTIDDVYNDSCECLGSSVSISDLINQVNFTAFPNPMSEEAVIRLNSPITAANVSVDLLSIDGKLISQVFNGSLQKGQVNDIQLSVETLVEGIYLCRLLADDGSQKIIKLMISK